MVYLPKLREVDVFPVSGAVQLQLHRGSLSTGNHQGVLVLPNSVFQAFGRLRHCLGSVCLDLFQFCLVALVDLGQAFFEAGDLGVFLLRRNLGLAGIYSPLGCGATSTQYAEKKGQENCKGQSVT